MSQQHTSKRLAVPRNGTGRLNLDEHDRKRSQQQGQIIAAFQSEEGDTVSQSIPKRVVIRCDGDLLKPIGSTTFPCGVLDVQYTIGGQAKHVLVDSISQSALTVWATSVEVVPVYDERRITRLAAYNFTPCVAQQLSAAINTDDQDGDTGAADARWLDVVALDYTVPEFDNEISIHPVPEGARGVRILNGLDGDGAPVNLAALAERITFAPGNIAESVPHEYVMGTWTASNPNGIIVVPACARFLFLQFPADTFNDFSTPPFIEWIMAPATLSGVNA